MLKGGFFMIIKKLNDGIKVTALTPGNTYKVVKEHGATYEIDDDNGQRFWYPKGLFKVVEE